MWGAPTNFHGGNKNKKADEIYLLLEKTINILWIILQLLLQDLFFFIIIIEWHNPTKLILVLLLDWVGFFTCKQYNLPAAILHLSFLPQILN